MDDRPDWERPVFVAGARELTIRDVLSAAHFRGDLDAAWAGVCQVAAQTDSPTDDDEVQARSEQFRSDRDLITAEETERWLEQRGLTLEEFSDYFGRELIKETLTLRDEPPALAYADAPPELRDVLRIDLLIGGEFDRLAERLAWRFATGQVGGQSADWMEELRTREAAFQEFTASLLTERARRDALPALRVELTRFEIEMLELESLDAAHEALFCLKVDGETMAEVARDGCYPLRRRELHLAAVPEEARSALLSASLDEVLGPIAHGEEYLLCRLLRKTEPALTDETVRDRVDRFIIERHFSENLAQHVRWILAPNRSYAEAH